MVRDETERSETERKQGVHVAPAIDVRSLIRRRTLVAPFYCMVWCVHIRILWCVHIPKYEGAFSRCNPGTVTLYSLTCDNTLLYDEFLNPAPHQHEERERDREREAFSWKYPGTAH